MIPFASIKYPAHALILWFLMLNAALAAALIILASIIAKDLGLTASGRALALWSAFLVSLKFYFMSLSVGQSDVIVALFFVLFLAAYVRGRDIAGGLAFALILQFKPFFAPAMLYFLLAGRRKLFISSGAWFLALLIAPVAIAGFDKAMALLNDWVGILTMSIPSQILNHKNQSITYFIGKAVLNTGILGPSASAEAMSPVRSQPSGVSVSRVASGLFQ